MSFVEPLFLLGMLAAALPVVVHLINRRKAVRRPFPALQFLMRSNRREARGIKVRQWILMALRILILAFLAFSLAKPYVLSSAGVTASERLPTAIVYVVDDSYSMANADWWERAGEAFDEQMDRVRPWDEIALVTTTNPKGPVGRLTGTHSEVRDAFDELAPTQRGTQLIEALDVASEILSTSQLPNHRIVVIGDFARGGFPEARQPEQPLPYPTQLVSVRSSDEEPSNLAVVAVDYEQEGGSREVVWRVDATVKNFGPQKERAEIRLQIGDEVVSGGLVEVGPEQTATHTFRHRLDGTGARPARVELVDPDGLSVDDRRHFVMQLTDRIRTLLVNGEPSSVVYRDEMFFLERALNPRADSESTIVPELITREGLEAEEDLSQYDVVVLSNVSRLSPATAQRLEAFVDGGGGLLVSMGDQVDATAYNQTLSALLPKPLRGLKQLAEIDDPDAPLKITRLGNMRRQHPIFQVFELPGGSSLHSVQVFSYMLLEPSPPEQSTTLLSYKDSAPALLEREVGRGRVLLLTTTVDDEWTDMPYRTAFLPLTRRAVQYLARRATSEGKVRHRVGEQVSFELASLVRERAVIKTPDGERIVLEPVDGKVSFEPKRAGVYEVWADSDEDEKNRLESLTFAVNIDTSESELDVIPDEALAPWLAEDEQELAEARAKGEGPQKRVNLWPIFLFLITLFLLAETVLGTRRSVLARLWRKITGQSEPAV